MTHPPEPTSEQCNGNLRVADFEDHPAYACWYPQMGGYGSKCVIITEGTKDHGCFGAYIWHDGNFPFSGEYGDVQNPAYLHHCSPDQFIEFGCLVREFQVLSDMVAKKEVK